MQLQLYTGNYSFADDCIIREYTMPNELDIGARVSISVVLQESEGLV